MRMLYDVANKDLYIQDIPSDVSYTGSTNVDKYIHESNSTKQLPYFLADGVGSNGTGNTRYTSRPTNVAVLYCIKYTETDLGAKEEQITITLTNGAELAVDKVGSVIMFNFDSQSDFSAIQAQRWNILGQLPDGYKPSKQVGFPINWYSPNIVGYGIITPQGEISIYANQTATNATQFYCNVTYKV